MTRFVHAIAAVTLGVVAAVAVAAPASAHNYLVDSSPEPDSVVTELPAEFSVTTNERLLDVSGDGSAFRIIVEDADGSYYGDGCITVDDTTASTDAAIGEAGEYTLTWQVVSADGHPVSDSFTFEWAGEATADGSTTQPDCNGTLTNAGAETESAAGNPLDSTPYWIGAAVLAVIIAVGATLLLTRKR